MNANGYEIVEKQGITAASSASNLSRPTVYAILQKYPKQPKRIIPQYIKDFETTEGAKQFLSKNRNRIKTWRKCYRVGLKCYILLGKKDPLSWTVDDYRKLWTHEKFIDSVTKKTRDTVVFALRLWMKAMGKHDLLQLEEFATRGLKRPKSRKSSANANKGVCYLSKKLHCSERRQNGRGAGNVWKSGRGDVFSPLVAITPIYPSFRSSLFSSLSVSCIEQYLAGDDGDQSKDRQMSSLRQDIVRGVSNWCSQKESQVSKLWQPEKLEG
ncbi:MAG: hypothetical protein GX799_08080 [Crenarchaeota archaeon]|nr:hypothetical protein [Thermoproteota archaeon]